MRYCVLGLAMLNLLAGSPVAAEPPVIVRPVWKHVPNITRLAQKTVPASLKEEWEWEGTVDLICRICDKAGHVTCQVTGMSDYDPDQTPHWANVARRTFEGAQLDMQKTDVAKPGRLVHVVWRLVQD